LGVLAYELHHRLVVVRRAADRFLEDRRVGGDAGQSLIAKTRELARRYELAADVVEPQRLALALELFDRARSGGHARYLFAASLSAAARQLCTVTPAPMRVTRSFGLWRTTFAPPTLKASLAP